MKSYAGRGGAGRLPSPKTFVPKRLLLANGHPNEGATKRQDAENPRKEHEAGVGWFGGLCGASGNGIDSIQPGFLGSPTLPSRSVGNRCSFMGASGSVTKRATHGECRNHGSLSGKKSSEPTEQGMLETVDSCES